MFLAAGQRIGFGDGVLYERTASRGLGLADHLTRLQISHHAPQFGPVGACAGCLLAVDAGDVMPGKFRGRDDPFLALKLLRFGAHAPPAARPPTSS